MSTELNMPQVGDDWEIRVPGKSKKVKTVGSVELRHFSKWNGDSLKWEHYSKPYVWWERRNKGRYTGLTVETLLKYGKRLSTKAERDAAFEARFAKRKLP